MANCCYWALVEVIVADIKNNVDNVVDAVLSCELVEKSTIYGFQGNKKSNFIKITLAVPKMVAAARRLIEKGEVSAWQMKHQGMNIAR